MNKLRTTSCAVELPGGAPEWIQLLPAGDVRSRDGRRWRLDAPVNVIAASLERAGATDIPIDYEHQTDLAPDNGQPAPAAGWIKALEARAGAIWGRVEWTERAAEHIRQREYRYVSPTFIHGKNGRIKMIMRAALTNSPALDLQALAKTEEDNPMKQTLIDKILNKLGLKASATDADVEQALANLEAPPADEAAKADDVDALSQVAAAIGLDGEVSADAIVAKAKALREQMDAASSVDPQAYVPRSEFDAAAKQLAALQEQTAAAKATAVVDVAVAAGKVSPAQRGWALAYAKADGGGFDKYVVASPVIVAPEAIGTGKTPSHPDAALTEDEVAVCKALGITAEQFKESKKDEEVAV